VRKTARDNPTTLLPRLGFPGELSSPLSLHSSFFLFVFFPRFHASSAIGGSHRAACGCSLELRCRAPLSGVPAAAFAQGGRALIEARYKLLIT
jgi:hypothetical protein